MGAKENDLSTVGQNTANCLPDCTVRHSREAAGGGTNLPLQYTGGCGRRIVEFEARLSHCVILA